MKRDKLQALFICHSAWSQRGGIQSFNRKVIEGMEAEGIASRSIVIHDRSGLSKRVLGTGGSALRALAAFCRSVPGAQHLFLGHVNYLPFAIIYRLLNPCGTVTLFAHGVEVWGGARYRKVRFYEPWLMARVVDRVAVVSDYSRRLMARSFSLPDRLFIQFPNAASSAAGRVNEIASPRKDVVICVARLARSEPEKNVDQTIRAFAMVVARLPAARLVIIGDGEMRLKLEALARNCGIADNVDFTGFIEQDALERAYREAAVFALPSSKEGFGIVYLEAWLHGLPVIASIHGAGGEVVTHESDGLVVDPADLSQLAEAMIELLVNTDKRRTFAKRGFEKATTRYSVSAFNERLANLCA